MFAKGILILILPLTPPLTLNFISYLYSQLHSPTHHPSLFPLIYFIGFLFLKKPTHMYVNACVLVFSKTRDQGTEIGKWR